MTFSCDDLSDLYGEYQIDVASQLQNTYDLHNANASFKLTLLGETITETDDDDEDDEDDEEIFEQPTLNLAPEFSEPLLN